MVAPTIRQRTSFSYSSLSLCVLKNWKSCLKTEDKNIQTQDLKIHIHSEVEVASLRSTYN